MRAYGGFECNCERFRAIEDFRRAILDGNPSLGAARAYGFARRIAEAEARENYTEMHRLINEALYTEKTETKDAA